MHKVTESGGYFGDSVSIYGNYAIAGDYGLDTAYWYQRKNNGSWEEMHKVTTEDTDSYFGRAVGIYGNYAIVGGDGGGSKIGIANIYQRENNFWSNS